MTNLGKYALIGLAWLTTFTAYDMASSDLIPKIWLIMPSAIITAFALSIGYYLGSERDLHGK